MRKALKIIWHIALGLLIALYVSVAAINYSLVQSYLGTAAGRYFSREWGGEVKIGSLHATPWDHLILHNVLLVSPRNDTIFRCESLRVRFNHFPFHNAETGGKLDFDRVYLKNAYYHFEKYLNREYGGEGGINLKFIIDYYRKPNKIPSPPSDKVFTVNVRSLTLRNVHYRMDLPDYGRPCREHGVEIKHMEFFDINGRFRNVHVMEEDVTARIVKLSTRERSGFVVDNISADVHVSPQDITVRSLDVETPNSHIMLDTRMTYADWMDNYEHEVEHEVEIKEGTTVAMCDVAYWAPVLWGVNVQLQAEGTAYGRIDSLATEGLWIGYGGATSVTLAGAIAGLPDIEQTIIDVSHLEVKTEESDMLRLEHDMTEYLPTKLIEYLRKAEYVNLQASGRGKLSGPAAANINLVCGIGNLRADVGIAPHGRRRRVTLEANSDGMGLSLLGSDWLTHSGLSLSAEAYIPKRVHSLTDIEGEASLELTNSVVRGNHMAPIDILCRISDGNAEFTVNTADSLLNLNAEMAANIGSNPHRFTAEVNLDHINAAAFGLIGEKYSTGSTRLSATATGNSIDELTGTLVARNSQLGQVRLREVRLDVDASGSHKTMRLESDPLGATLYGSFDYGDLPLMVRHMLATVLPAELNIAEPLDTATLAKISSNTLNLNAQWNDNSNFLHSLTDGIHLAHGSRLSASYNNGEMLKMVMRSDSIRIGSVLLTELGLSSRMSGDTYIVELESDNATLGKLPLISDIGIILNSNRERASLGLAWGGNSDNRGDMMFSLHDGKIDIEKPWFYTAGTRWEVASDSISLHRDNRLKLSANGISISSDEQRIGANIRFQGQSNDCVELDFEQFNLDGLCDMMLQGDNVAATGRINGRFYLYGLDETPYFNANLVVDSCTINRQTLGDVAVRSNWNAELNTLNLQLHSDQIDAHGWLGLGKKETDLNFSVNFNSLDLSLAAPFMKAFTSRFEGLLQGQFDIAGTTASPVIVGEALVENGALKIDLSGVTYFFSDSIRFASNIVTLDRFKVLDPMGNIAYLDGTIRHNGLRNAVLDLAVQTDNLLMYDQPDGDHFYGRVMAAANGNVGGSLGNLDIVVDARTMPGCTISVPVNNQRQVKSQNYITFVSDEAEIQRNGNDDKSDGNGINLEVDLNITPDVKVNLPMDFSGVAVTVGANGFGDLHMSYDGVQSPHVLGNYEITNGTMKLSLLSVVDKNFTIESGSNLNFQGSAPDARFDMKAVYSQRVNLSTLTGSLSAIDNTQKYIQVENVIAVNGTITEPNISFDLRLPNADQSVEDEVFAYIDRNNERDMLNQTMTLLVSGNFYNVSGNDQSNAAAGGLGTLASTLGGMMADMVNIVDINVDYRAATDMTNQQLDLNISKDWGRWYLESTLGYGGESRELETRANGGAVIDALVGYRISPLVHLFAYNRTNTNDYTRMDLPYKQGVGLKLTKDFDRWGDLLKRKKKKK